MQSYHKKRLLKLADYLARKVRNEKFNLDIVRETIVKKKKNKVVSCGTIGCAIGYMPEVFPRDIKSEVIDPNDDFDYLEDGDEEEYQLEVCFKDTKRNEKAGYYNPNGHDCFDLASKYFGISYAASHYLFNPSDYPRDKRSKKDVVQRIRDFVKLNGEN